jgi:hypothetical protein
MFRLAGCLTLLRMEVVHIFISSPPPIAQYDRRGNPACD